VGHLAVHAGLFAAMPETFPSPKMGKYVLAECKFDRYLGPKLQR
jgi:hypothetical protein